MQVFMGQAWADHNADFLDRARQADRITFADLGVVQRRGIRWAVENPSNEATAFMLVFINQKAA
jgi:hypothetical protein